MCCVLVPKYPSVFCLVRSTTLGKKEHLHLFATGLGWVICCYWTCAGSHRQSLCLRSNECCPDSPIALLSQEQSKVYLGAVPSAWVLG